MAKIILCRGIQGSGKTTWAKNYCNEHPNSIRVNRDDLRAMMGCKWFHHLEIIVRGAEFEAIKTALDLGFTVVVDDVSNLNSETVESIQHIVEAHNNTAFKYKYLELQEYSIEYQDFFIPLQDCIDRDAKRPNPIGEEVIRKTYEKYKDIIEYDKNKFN